MAFSELYLSAVAFESKSSKSINTSPLVIVAVRAQVADTLSNQSSFIWFRNNLHPGQRLAPTLHSPDSLIKSMKSDRGMSGYWTLMDFSYWLQYPRVTMLTTSLASTALEEATLGLPRRGHERLAHISSQSTESSHCWPRNEPYVDSMGGQS